MKNTYITAQEAKALVAAAHDIDGTYKQKETEEILMQIRGSATSGKTDIEFGVVDKVVIRRLETLGFTVRVRDDQREGTSTNISWGNP